MSHAYWADKLLIKPAAGARPAPPHTRGQIIPKARTRRPVTRRVTHGTATTRLATNPDRPTRRALPSPETEHSLGCEVAEGRDSSTWCRRGIVMFEACKRFPASAHRRKVRHDGRGE